MRQKSLVKFYTAKIYLWTEIGEFDGKLLVKHTCPVCGFGNKWTFGCNPKNFREHDMTQCDKCRINHYLSKDGLTLTKREIIEALVAPEGAILV